MSMHPQNLRTSPAINAKMRGICETPKEIVLESKSVKCQTGGVYKIYKPSSSLSTAKAFRFLNL